MATLEFKPGDTISLTASFEGTVDEVEWSWVVPEGSSAPTSNTDTLSWIANETDSGVYISEARSNIAVNSPMSESIRVSSFETEVNVWLDKVEKVDGQFLEFGVSNAVNNFTANCKKDGNWNSIDQVTVAMGVRTPEAAIISLKGPDLIGSNITSGDYNRSEGYYGSTWTGFKKEGFAELIAMDVLRIDLYEELNIVIIADNIPDQSKLDQRVEELRTNIESVLEADYQQAVPLPMPLNIGV